MKIGLPEATLHIVVSHSQRTQKKGFETLILGVCFLSSCGQEIRALFIMQTCDSSSPTARCSLRDSNRRNPKGDTGKGTRQKMSRQIPTSLRQFSAVKHRDRERKGPQRFRLRNWPISSADFPMTPMEGTEHHFGLFRRRILGKYAAAPCSPGPFV